MFIWVSEKQRIKLNSKLCSFEDLEKICCKYGAKPDEMLLNHSKRKKRSEFKTMYKALTEEKVFIRMSV